MPPGYPFILFFCIISRKKVTDVFLVMASAKCCT